MAETIKRIHENESVAPLFLDADTGSVIELE
jgi:hypothetical protein